MNTFIKLTWRKIPHMVNIDHITFYKPTDCTDHNRGTEVYLGEDHLLVDQTMDQIFAMLSHCTKFIT